MMFELGDLLYLLGYLLLTGCFSVFTVIFFLAIVDFYYDFVIMEFLMALLLKQDE